jgi:hypothetical protein
MPDSNIPDSKPTLLQLAEAEILACVLAQPDLLVGIDFEETPLEVREIVQLFDWAAEALAIGRNSGAEVFRYLFTRAADLPRLQSMLAHAHARAERMKAPGEVLIGLMDGRSQRVHGTKRRSLRERLSAAIKAGDTETAAELQKELLESKRRHSPRKVDMPDGAAPAAPASHRKPPAFGFAAKAAEAAEAHQPEPPIESPPIEGPPMIEGPPIEGPPIDGAPMEGEGAA